MFLELLLTAVTGLNATELSLPIVKDQTQSVVNTYSIRGLKVQVAQVDMNNPSPLLTRSSASSCTVMLNNNSTARFIWAKFVDSKEAAEESAMQGFAIAHELGHCLLANARGKADQELPVLSAQLSSATQGQGVPDYSVKTLIGRKSVVGGEDRFDETFCDLLGLHYVSQKHPEQFSTVLEKLKSARESFSSSDQSHHSTPFLTAANLRMVDRFLLQQTGKASNDAALKSAERQL